MNRNEDLPSRLIWEIEDALSVDGTVRLHEFSWALRGLLRELSLEVEPGEFDRTVMYAYGEVRRRHDLRLVWMDWPSAYHSEAGPNEPLDFEIVENSHGPSLVLVPANRRFDSPGATGGE